MGNKQPPIVWKRDPEDVISGMIKPVWCEKTETGQVTWEMICAAIRDDTETLKRHLMEDPDRARNEFWYISPIHFAAREGALEATKVLWEAYPCEMVTDLIEIAQERGHGAVADYLGERIVGNGNADPRLHEAIEAKDEKEALRLLDAHPDLVHGRDSDGDTPLHRAVLKQCSTVARRLLAAGAPIDATNHRGFRPVHHGYWEGRWSMLRGDKAAGMGLMLLDAGAKDSITLAAARGDMYAVKCYLAGCEALANDGDTLEKRPLSTAVDRGDQEMLRLLLEHGAAPNLREGPAHPYGSGLMTASVNDDVEIAALLLEAGANPNGYVDSSGTPTGRAHSDAMRGLMYAYGGIPGNAWGYIQQGNLEMIAMILTLDPDPFSDETIEYLSTPYTAVVSGYNRKADKGESTTAHEAIFDMLIKRNFPMPEVLTECRSYLFSPGYMTRTMLEKGLNPNLPNWQRQTPLHHLADSSESQAAGLATADLLLEFGADINAVDEAEMSTPLSIAACRGNMEFVSHFLSKGADPNKAGAAWSRPLARAERRGHSEVAALLKKHGGE